MDKKLEITLRAEAGSLLVTEALRVYAIPTQSTYPELRTALVKQKKIRLASQLIVNDSQKIAVLIQYHGDSSDPELRIEEQEAIKEYMIERQKSIFLEQQLLIRDFIVTGDFNVNFYQQNESTGRGILNPTVLKSTVEHVGGEACLVGLGLPEHGVTKMRGSKEGTYRGYGNAQVAKEGDIVFDSKNAILHYQLPNYCVATVELNRIEEGADKPKIILDEFIEVWHRKYPEGIDVRDFATQDTKFMDHAISRYDEPETGVTVFACSAIPTAGKKGLKKQTDVYPSAVLTSSATMMQLKQDQTASTTHLFELLSAHFETPFCSDLLHTRDETGIQAHMLRLHQKMKEQHQANSEDFLTKMQEIISAWVQSRPYQGVLTYLLPEKKTNVDAKMQELLSSGLLNILTDNVKEGALTLGFIKKLINEIFQRQQQECLGGYECINGLSIADPEMIQESYAQTWTRLLQNPTEPTLSSSQRAAGSHSTVLSVTECSEQDQGKRFLPNVARVMGSQVVNAQPELQPLAYPTSYTGHPVSDALLDYDCAMRFFSRKRAPGEEALVAEEKTGMDLMSGLN